MMSRINLDYSGLTLGGRRNHSFADTLYDGLGRDKDIGRVTSSVIIGETAAGRKWKERLFRVLTLARRRQCAKWYAAAMMLSLARINPSRAICQIFRANSVRHTEEQTSLFR